jgi:protein FAM32A
MPSTDYTASSGALRLKGTPGVTKPKKKKSKKPAADAPSKPDASLTDPATTSTDPSKTSASKEPDPAEKKKDKPVIAKTAAEMRYEESRKRRLEERLRREGTRTHKERVEELNKYLSGLSEHHDMWVFFVMVLWVLTAAGRALDLDKTCRQGNWRRSWGCVRTML